MAQLRISGVQVVRSFRRNESRTSLSIKIESMNSSICMVELIWKCTFLDIADLSYAGSSLSTTLFCPFSMKKRPLMNFTLHPLCSYGPSSASALVATIQTPISSILSPAQSPDSSGVHLPTFRKATTSSRLCAYFVHGHSRRAVPRQILHSCFVE